jgi:hemoglobin-like flavoprotein
MNSNALILTPRYLTQQQVSLLKKSFRLMNSMNIASRFYSRLLEQYPEVAHLFPADNHELKEKLASVLQLVVFSFEEKKSNQFELQESLIIPLRDLGRKHEQKGVRNAHYPVGNSLLLQAIKDEMGNSFDEVSNAWQIALDLLTTAMTDASVDRQIGSATEGSFFRQLLEGLKKKNLFSP